MKADMVRGHLDVLILAVLDSGPQHGYAVIETLQQRSEGLLELPTGTVYPALRRLERGGLLAGDWSTVGGRQRRTYRLTRAGRRVLSAERADWRSFSRVVDTIVEGGPWPTPA